MIAIGTCVMAAAVTYFNCKTSKENRQIIRQLGEMVKAKYEDIDRRYSVQQEEHEEGYFDRREIE